MPLLHVDKPVRARDCRIPIIFTPQQIRSLLTAAMKAKWQGDEIDGTTLRMILLVLYATGATVEEVVHLRRSNVDLKRRCIEFNGTSRQLARKLPIGRDLHRELGAYIRTHYIISRESPLFRFKNGCEIKRYNLWNRFGRLCGMVGIPASRWSARLNLYQSE
jgi:site-specific recombinase XerD